MNGCIHSHACISETWDWEEGREGNGWPRVSVLVEKAPVEDLCCGTGGGKNALSPGPVVTKEATCKEKGGPQQPGSQCHCGGRGAGSL